MKILIACECSGLVRDAFKAKGHNTTSCDLEDTERPGQHIRGDVLNLLSADWKWDMLIAFPPCTHLCVSGARWFKDKLSQQDTAIQFFRRFVNAPIHYIAIENPIGIMSRLYRRPDQIIQPWQFGHDVPKSTCLWLKNLPKLIPTPASVPLPILTSHSQSVHLMPPSSTRSKDRSRTYAGIAHAMAEQWGTLRRPSSSTS